MVERRRVLRKAAALITTAAMLFTIIPLHSAFAEETGTGASSEKSYTYTDEVYGAGELVTVTATLKSGEELPEGKLDGLFFGDNEEDETYQSVREEIKRALKEAYTVKVTDNELQMNSIQYRLSFRNEEEPDTGFPEDTEFHISAKHYMDFGNTGTTSVAVFTYADGELTRIRDAQYDTTTKIATFTAENWENIFLIDERLIEEKESPDPSPVKTEKSYTYTDEILGAGELVTVTATLESGEELPDGKLDCLFFGDNEEDETYQSVREEIKSALKEAYTVKATDNELQMNSIQYRLSFRNEEEPDTGFPEDTEFRISAKHYLDFDDTGTTPVAVFTYADGELTRIRDAQYDTTTKIATFTAENWENIFLIDERLIEEKESPDPSPGPGDLGANLETGVVYDVSANIYVDGKDNVVLADTTAYMTNPAVPPLTPVEHNARIVKEADGTMTLTVSGLNALFTLQDIQAGEGFDILERETVEGDFGKYQTRIDKLVIKLKDVREDYTFGLCTQFPLPLIGTAAEGDKHMAMQLNIDFSSARRAFLEDAEGMWQKVFSSSTDPDYSILLKTSEKELTGNLDEIELKMTDKTKSAESDEIIRQYGSGAVFEMYDFTFEYGGDPVDLTDTNSLLEFSVKTEYESPVVYSYEDGAIKTVSSSVEDGILTFSARKQGIYAVVDEEASGRWIGITYESDQISYGFYCDPGQGGLGGMSSVSALEPKIEKSENGTKYYIGFQEALLSSSFSVYKEGNRCDVTIPYEEGQRIYVAREVYIRNDNGVDSEPTMTLNEVDLSSAAVRDGMITFDLLPAEGTDENYGCAVLEALYNGLKGGESAKDRPTGYIYVTHAKVAGMPEKIQAPYESASLGCTYNDTLQTRVRLGANSRLTADSDDLMQKDAGSYTVTAEPMNGYVWMDGTNEPRTVSWKINKASITYRCDDVVVKEGEVPVFGDIELYYSQKFYGGESEASLVEEKPYIEANSDLENLGVGVYPIKITGGRLKTENPASENYQFKYLKPEIRVVSADAKLIECPEANSGLKANGSEQVGVPEGEGYTLSGTWKASQEGEYTAYAKLKDGYYWSDNGARGYENTRSIKWSIGAESSGGSSQDKEKTVTANLFIDGEDNKVLPGVTAYLTNPDNPAGIGSGANGVPTTPVADNAQYNSETGILTLETVNPVFTLQRIGGCENAEVTDVATEEITFPASAPDKTSYTTRISRLKIKLKDKSGTYVFDDCTEFPTILGQTWTAPLTLKVKFDGGTDSSLDSNTDVDTDGIIGGGGSKEEVSDISTVTDPETGAVTETIKYKDGSVSVTVTQKDGSSVNDYTTKNGSSSRTEKDKNGKSVTDIRLEKADLQDTAKDKAHNLPMPAISAGIDTTVKISDMGGQETLRVSIPVENAGPGTVAVKMNTDGSSEVVSGTVYGDKAVSFTAEKGVTYKICDNAAEFADVTADAWYRNAVDYITARGIMNGTSDTAFSPDRTTSRGMIVTMLYRMENNPEAAAKAVFSDVESGQYYADAVAWASEKGIVTGYGDGTFRADDPITREQLTAILYRYADSPKTEGTLDLFTDRESVSGYAADAMVWAVKNSIMNGKGDGILDPKGNASRAHAAQILMNFFQQES